MNLKKSIESVILACTLLLVSAAGQAATFVDITAVSDDGDIGVAKLIYFDAAIVGGVVTTFHPGSTIEIFGQTFSLSDAFDTPTLTLSGGLNPDTTVEHTSFDVTFVDMSPIDILESGIESFSFGDLTHTGFNGKAITYSGVLTTTTVVPLPASAWLFVSGLLGLVGMQRRRKG